MTRPNLFIVGAPKCGTTAWYSYLKEHPDIFFPDMKEPHYFNTDMPGYRWVTNEVDYLRLFEPAKGAQVVGEASVHYLASSEAAARIAAFAPQARILIFVRPLESFLGSYHNQMVLNLDEDLTAFTDAWHAADTPGGRALPETCRDPKVIDYRDAGQFGAQIARYLAHFPPQHVMILPYAEWTADPRAAYLRVLSFLDVPDDGRTSFGRVHEAKTVASRRIALLTQRPPPWVLACAHVLKRMLGRERLGMAGVLRRANSRSGYAAATPEHTRPGRDVLEYFEQDQALLKQQIESMRGVHD